jgi:peptidoglycan/LPS O-acetylase OafA/YrhL
MTRTPGADPRLLELDALRGIAAIGVIASHLYPEQCYWMGSFVYLFFVLSGFLITRGLLTTATVGGTTLKHFWARRAIRIWPVYYITLAGCALYTAASLRLGTLPDGSWRNAVASLFFVQYLDYYVTPTQPFPPEFLTFFVHSWTLAVEEQFYLLWPLLIVVLRRHFAGLVMLCIALMCATIIARGQGIPGFVLLGVLDALAIGALIAIFECFGVLRRHGEGMSHRAWLGAAAAAFAAAPIIARYFDPMLESTRFDHQFLITAFAMAYGCGIIVLAQYSGHRLLTPLRHPLLVYAGTISYALYMFHVPIIGVFDVVLMRYNIARTLAVDALIWAVIAAAASASHVVLERPLSKLKHRFPM